MGAEEMNKNLPAVISIDTEKPLNRSNPTSLFDDNKQHQHHRQENP